MRIVDKAIKDSITNNLTVDLDVLGSFLKGGVVCDENDSLIIALHWHGLL